MGEAWTSLGTVDGIETAQVSGRTLMPWYKKINPIWWLGNHEEPWPPDWYIASLPASLPYATKFIAWYIRNPLVNFAEYVVGVSDRNYTCYGMAPVLVTAWNDLPPPWRTGFKWTVIDLGRIKLPFVSYVGKKIMWYAGWNSGGHFGFKFNLINTTLPQIV